jgi:hypothetical protein
MNRRLFWPIFVALLSGCAATGPVYEPVENADSGNALVYVFRGAGFAMGGRTAYFYVNDINVFDLDQGGYSWVSLPPGRYKLKQSWPIDVMAKPTELDLEARAGETLYFSFQTGMCKAGFREICVQWQFRGLPADEGRSAIADKRFQPNFGAAKLKSMLDREQ